MLPPLSFSGLFIVAAVAFLVPLLVGLSPRLRLPSVVIEIVVGIVIGPSVLGWVQVDAVLQVMALLGVAFSLLLAGLEIDFTRLRGPLLRVTSVGFLASFGLALAVGLGLGGVGLVQSPLFVAIVLSATALAVIVPVLKDTGQLETDFGQTVVVAASLADFGTIILLSLLFSREAKSIGAQVVLIGGVVALALALLVALRWVGRAMVFSPVLVRLQDTSAQLRVRGAFVLLAVFAVLAERFGLETILGAFLAGAILKLLDRDPNLTHGHFRLKLEAIGFGVFIPFFFVTSGIRFNLAALVANAASLALVPLFLGSFLLARGLPVLLYRGVTARQRGAAALLQATELGFIVIATQIGMELGVISAGVGAALVAAALLSILLFPLAALSLLRGVARPDAEGEATSTAIDTQPSVAYR